VTIAPNPFDRFLKPHVRQVEVYLHVILKSLW